MKDQSATPLHRCGKNIYHCLVWYPNDVADFWFAEVMNSLTSVSEGTKAYLQINKGLYHRVSCCPFLFLLWFNCFFHSCSSHFDSLWFSGCKIYSHVLQLLIVMFCWLFWQECLYSCFFSFIKHAWGLKSLFWWQWEYFQLVQKSGGSSKSTTLEPFSLQNLNIPTVRLLITWPSSNALWSLEQRWGVKFMAQHHLPWLLFSSQCHSSYCMNCVKNNQRIMPP